MKTSATLLLLALAASLSFSTRAQTPATSPAPQSILPVPPLPPVLPDNPTAAQRTEYERQSRDYERRRWNYVLTDSVARARILNEQPNGLLMETLKGLKPGKALDVGMGEGRNTVYLAQQGWQATGVDVADEAVAFARRKAALRGVKIDALVEDADTYDWGTNKWDLILISYSGGRKYTERVLKALKPGGLLVLEGFHKDAAKEHKIGEGVVFDTDEMKNLFTKAGLQIVRYEEPMAQADFGKYQVKLVKLVARKPLR